MQVVEKTGFGREQRRSPENEMAVEGLGVLKLKRLYPMNGVR
jgi:hypothetical protein